MKKSDYNSGDVIDDVQEINIIVKIPANAATLELVCQMIDDEGELFKLSKKYTPEDIRAARKDFLDNVEDGDDYDARYVITDSGRELLEYLRQHPEFYDDAHLPPDPEI